MTQEVSSLVDTGIERYKAGEGPQTLIPFFKDICDRAPKTSSAWSCLAWLYLLDDKPQLAYKAAQKAVKLNPNEPQSRINLAVAMLEAGQAGVREHVENAQQLLATYPEYAPEVKETLEEGLSRKPDWKSLTRIKNWLFPS
jgi:predicted Zn-dependent protease